MKKINGRNLLKYLKLSVASIMLSGITAMSALAADVTMNVGFGAPEQSFYGNFAKIFEAKAGNIQMARST